MNTQGMPVDARIEIFRKFMNDNGNLIAQHLIDRLEPAGFFTAARDARYGEENAQFHAVRENLLRLGTAKDCIKYLKSINIDVSDIESGSVDKVKDLKPVDPDKFRLPNKEGN